MDSSGATHVAVKPAAPSAAQQLDKLMHLMQDAVLLTDSQRRIMDVNPAMEAMLGRARDELIGRPTRILHTDDDRAAALGARVAECVAQRAPLRTEWVLQHATRGPFPVDLAITPLQEGEVTIGLLGVVRDLTRERQRVAELEQLGLQLAQSEKLSALGSLVGGVAHELRTPLTYLSNNLSLVEIHLQRTYRELPEERAEWLRARLDERMRDARESIDRIDRLVEDLRKFTKLKPARSRALAPLDAFAREAVDLFRATHRGQVVLDADLRTTPAIRGDRVQLQQVVLNLLQNAYEARPTDNTVRVRTYATPDAAVLEVDDRGEGIPPDVQARMWDPFYTTKAEGTGLGLSIVKRILDEHAARVEIESGRGRGTRLRILFPCA